MDVKVDINRANPENVELEMKSIALAKKLFNVITTETTQISVGVRALDFLALALAEFDGVPQCMHDSQELTRLGLKTGILKVSIREVM
jgi:hypothetical protein